MRIDCKGVFDFDSPSPSLSSSCLTRDSSLATRSFRSLTVSSLIGAMMRGGKGEPRETSRPGKQRIQKERMRGREEEGERDAWAQDLSAGLESNRGREMVEGGGELWRTLSEVGWWLLALRMWCCGGWSSSASALLGGGRGFVVVMKIAKQSPRSSPRSSTVKDSFLSPPTSSSHIQRLHEHCELKGLT